MYLYMYNIYIQLGYLFKAETSITICLPALKKQQRKHQQTFSKTFPLFSTYTSFVNSTKRTMS